MRINPFVYGVVVLTVFLGIILGFQSVGFWSISGKVDASGAAIQPLAADVNTIKGWMTLEQITKAYDVPLAELLQQFGLPADTPPSTAISGLESDVFSVTNLRTWLQSRTQPSETAPAAGATLVPTLSITPISAAATAVTPSATEHVAPDKTITGKTTFQDLLGWGVSKENIQKVIGGDIPVPSTVIKDYATGKGVEFTTIKTQLQAEVDKIK